MNKIVSFIFLLALLTSLTACFSNDNETHSTTTDITATTNTTEAETTVQSDIVKDDATAGEKLLDSFYTAIEADPAISADKLAEAILSNSIIEFEGAQMPVENGLLTGFGNAEITGFKEGVMFSPMISTIPFIGYIFILEDNVDAEEFIKTLKDNADLRWNICTEADEMIVDYSGNTVFFLMCPNSLAAE